MHSVSCSMLIQYALVLVNLLQGSKTTDIFYAHRSINKIMQSAQRSPLIITRGIRTCLHFIGHYEK